MPTEVELVAIGIGSVGRPARTRLPRPVFVWLYAVLRFEVEV